jgi:hypothetical protein
MIVTCPHCATSFEAMEEITSVRCRSCGQTFDLYAPKKPAPAEPPPTAAPAAAPGEGPGAVAAVDSARCAKHPNNPAKRACARCGDYVCDVCATPVEGQTLCVACYEYKETQGELRSSQAAFRLPTYSLVVGLLSLLCGWIYCTGMIMGPTAIVLGIIALAQISKKPALPGKGQAIAGVILGTLGIIGPIIAVFVIAWLQMREQMRT